MQAKQLDPKTAEAALETLRPQLEGITELKTVRTSALEAVEVALGVAQKAQEDTPRLTELFASPPLAQVEQLKPAALALWAAQTKLDRVRKVKDPKERQALLEEGQMLQKLLADAARYLWSKDERLKERVRDILRGRGYQDMVDDLVAYADLFEQNWEYADNNCLAKKEHVKRAGELAPVLLSLLRPQDDEEEKAALRLRDQAWTFLVQTYTTVSRACALLFDPEEAEVHYPASLPSAAMKLLLSRQRKPSTPPAAAPPETPES